MSIDKLRYQSQNVSIATRIKKYPKHLGIREVIQNCIEGDGKTGATDIQILSLQTKVSGLTGNSPKLAVWDNGPGMTAKQLVLYTDMASSPKQMRGTNNPNFGEGEVASTLSYNSYGVWWISCKDGKTNLVWIKFEGEDPGRHEFDEVCPVNDSIRVINIDDTDLYDSFKEQYPDLFTGINFTMKVFLGDTDDQNTCTNPFGNSSQKGSNNLAYNALYERYHHMPGPNLKIDKNKRLVTSDKKVQITFNEGTVDKKQGKTKVFSTKSQNFTKTLKGGIKNQLDAEQEVVTDKETGIMVVYNFDGYQLLQDGSGQKNSTGQRASFNSGWRAMLGQCVSIVYHGENYGRLSGNKFYPFMRRFGLHTGADQFGLTVILPETYDSVFPEMNRQILKWETAPTYSSGEMDEQVTIYDFDELIRRNMPEWYVDKIKEARKTLKSNDKNSSRLDAFIDSLFLSGTGKGGGKSKLTKPVVTPRGPNKNKPKTGLTPRNTTNKGKNGFEAPKAYLLTSEQFNKDEGNEDRAANYISITNELAINQDYIAITSVIDTFLDDHQDDSLAPELNEEIYDLIREIVINEFSFRLLCTVCKGIFHKKQGKWDEREIDDSYLSPTSLSSVADSLELFVSGELSTDIKKQVTALKNADKTIQASEVDQRKWERNGVGFPEDSSLTKHEKAMDKALEIGEFGE